MQNAINYLTTTQLPNGSWNDDPYSTALALRALANVKPNLSISSTDITYTPSAPTPGDTVTITATTKNNGLVDANNVTIAFYDGDPNAGGLFIGETVISNIPQNGNGTASINWTASTSGIHNIFVFVGYADDIEEGNESDNLTIAQIRVYEKIDLTVQGITFIPELPSPGQTVDAQVKVANMGGLQVGNVVVRLSADGVIIGEKTISVLGSLKTQTETFPLQNPSTGIHQITASVDPENAIVEGDETNNTLTQYLEVKERIDLVASRSWIYFSKSKLKEGEIVYITAVIYNARENTASNVVVRFYDGDPNTGGIQIAGDQIIPSIRGGGTGQTDWISYDTSGKSGRHTVYLVVDPMNTIEETDELNNTAINSFTVDGRPDLIVQEIQFTPISPEEGDMVQIKAIVKNIGSTQSGSTKLKFYRGDPSSGGEQIGLDQNIGNINPSAAYTTGSITFNTTDKPGDNQIYAVIDPFNSVDEINETNNTLSRTLTVKESTRPDLTLTSSDISFSPSKPATGDIITISARIWNLRNTPASNVTVSFFDGNPATGGILLGSISLPHIADMGTEKAELIWDATGIKGKHSIYVKIDPDNLISEANEANNEAFTVLKIRLPQGAAPQNLSAIPINATDIELNWEPGPEAEAYGIVGYNIYRNNVWVNSLKDISREGTASASSSYLSYTPDKAIDGNVNTYWWAAYKATLPQWWQQDFSLQRKIKKVAIYWDSTYYAKDFEIQTWDGTQWVTQSIVTGNNKDITVHEFLTTVITNKVRIYITSANNINYPAVIREIDIYENRLIETTTYQDKGLGAGTYTYYATAVDGDDVESLPSNEATTSLGDIIPPAPPGGLIATVTGFNINLTWSANTEPDLAGYRIYRDDLNIAHKGRGTVIIGSNGSLHDYVIDGSTATSGYTQWNTTPPGTMIIILSKVYEIEKLRMLLYEGTDNRFYRYKIESSIDGQNWQTVMDRTSGEWQGWQEVVFTHSIQARYFRITGTFCSTENYFKVSEFEAYTFELVSKTLDTSGSLSVNVTNYSNFYEYTYDWNSGSRQARKFVFSEFNTEENDVLYIYDKDTGALLASYSGNPGTFITPPLTATNYRFQFIADYEGTASGFSITKYIIPGKQTTRTYSETIYENGNYRYAVTAIDTSGNESALSTIVTATIADTTPPAIPKNLTAKAGNGVVDLTWTKNTEPDLAGYNLYRNGEVTPLNGSTLINTNSYKDLNVNNLTTYTYQITAVDVNGNESPKSTPVTATPTGIDLTIKQTETAVDLFIFPLKPTIFDTATIVALVRNTGTDTINNVKVSFYDGNPFTGGTLIGSTIITEDITENGTEIAQITWNLRDAEGTHTIYAVVDPENMIPELNETNNSVYKQFSVTTNPVITVDVNTVDASNFPTIEARVRVRDANDNGIFGLNENNFTVTENGNRALPITVTALTDPQKRIPKVDIVFVVDTSGSMTEEWQTMCGVIDDIVELLSAQGIDLSYTMYGLASQYTPGDCSTVLSQVIYNGKLKSAHEEDWGPGTTWVAINYPWRQDAARIVIPISDENAYAGVPETQEDLNSIQEAIEACMANEVIAYPFYSYVGGNTLYPGVKEEAESLAAGTGGVAFLFEDANQIINEIVKAARRSVSIILLHTLHQIPQGMGH
jgi:subtilase family serine protease